MNVNLTKDNDALNGDISYIDKNTIKKHVRAVLTRYGRMTIW